MEKIHLIFDLFERMAPYERRLRLDALLSLYCLTCGEETNKCLCKNQSKSVKEKDKLPEDDDLDQS